MKLTVAAAAAAAALLLALAAAAGAVTYEVTNNASTTPGGQRFDRDYGEGYAAQVLSEASCFTWSVFNQTSPADRRPVSCVALVVSDLGNVVAFTDGSTIELGSRYVAGYAGDVRTEVTGVLYHEVVHVWQWGLQDYGAHSWVYEGIADFVRLKAGLAPAHWVKRGEGNSWEDSYAVTAWFLDYCDSLKPGFVAELNAKLKAGYSVDYFKQISGKSVQELWLGYKAKYGG